MIPIGGTRTPLVVLALCALCALCASLSAAASAAPADLASSGARFAPGELLVRYEPGTSGSERARVRDELDADLDRRMLVPRLEVLDLAPGDSVKAADAQAEAQPAVAFAEPNYVYELSSTYPIDTFFDELWGLENTGTLGGADDADIDAPEAWDVTTGSSDVVVGVVDSGIALEHPELDDNLWVNPAEDTGAPAVDDEPNGFTDDLHGWDFVDDDDDPSDEEGHGTHVAGTIGAEGNNNDGVTGVDWDVSLMALRACNRLGSCLSSDIADAFTYAAANGAQVVNASLSGTGSSLAQSAAISSATDTLFVVAAGNEGSNNDVSGRFPCNYTAANLICVAATNDEDNLASFSNYGRSAVDLAAPGGGSPGYPVRSTYALDDRMSETFTLPLGPKWDTGGTPDAWARTNETGDLPGATLTDSPGGDYANDTDSYARFGPVDLSPDSDCYLRYDLALDVPDPDDHLVVEGSTDDFTYTPIQDWTGAGVATLTPDIPLLAGSPTVYIRFRFVSDSAVTGGGAHVDNVRIRCHADDYALLQGTSMATPHVSGTAALMLAANPAATVSELRDWLLDGTDSKASLAERVSSGGRLNAARSVAGATGADIRRPITTIISGPSPTSRATTASFSFSANEPSSFSCSHNGNAFAPCTSPQTLSALAVGPHTFQVKATDTAGNEDSTPASYSFNVEPTTLSAACLKARAKLKKARTAKQRKKLRKQVRRKCV